MNEKKKSSAALSTALILIAGVFWGSMGIFVRKLGEYGFDSIQIVCLRMTMAAIVFMLLHVILERDCILIKLRDLPLFLGLGLGSILFFTICYFTAISIMPLSTAAILLYTSPIWVMLMSCVFFKERLTVRKLAALVCAFGGCVLVSGFSSGVITVKGLLIGLGSGIGYGLYSILGSVALKKYSSLTVTTFTFIIAAAGAWCVCAPAEMTAMIVGTENIWALLMLVILTALVTAVIPFSAYTAGLKSVEPSKAAILATVEPMVATILGAIVFAEPITVTSGIGIALIFASVVILNLKSKK